MIVSIVYFLFFFLLTRTYYIKHGINVGTFLLLLYFVSVLLTLIESFWGPINHPTLEPDATFYYTVCVLISLWPFLLLAKYDCSFFEFSYIKICFLSYFLVFFGLIEVVTSVVDIYNNRAIFFGNIADVRLNFYDNTLDNVILNRSVFDKVIILMHYLQYMTPFCSIYMLSRGNTKFAFLLSVASLGFPLHNMTIGEREAILIFFSNWFFCFIFFRSLLSKKTKKKFKRIAFIFALPFVVFFVAMTVGRFLSAQSNIGGIESLLRYGGDMPFYFSHIFIDPSIEAQKLGGVASFNYLFPVSERLHGGYNEYINSDIYLNQFGGLAGTFYLDFGRYAIFVIASFAIAYYMFVKSTRRKNGKYPYHLFLLFYFSFQVLFMNIFYFDFNGLYKLFLPFLYFLISWISSSITFSSSKHM